MIIINGYRILKGYGGNRLIYQKHGDEWYHVSTCTSLEDAISYCRGGWNGTY